MIGSGGFAEVWAVFDRKLQRTVAVKVIHPDLVASRAMLERFQREAQAVAKLRHPGVIPIYAVGEHEGFAYYIMPLVEGESLRSRLAREGALPPAEAGRILLEAAAALAAAHKAGIIHRDIKPENLMLEGDDRRVLVMDFGIAKSTSGTQSGLTGTGMIIGTPAYMSPEQATGSGEIDIRSDVYSLGVVGYELLTGKQPFTARSVPELIMQHVSQPAPSVSAGRDDIPEPLAIAVNRCLMKKPEERWKDAGELSAFLGRVATPASQIDAVPKDLRKFARRRWMPTGRQVFWAALGVTALTLAALLGVSPSSVKESLLYWSGITRLAKQPTRVSGDESGVAGRMAPWGWALGYARVLPMGDSGLAVVDLNSLEHGLQVFDGRRWMTSALQPGLDLGASVPVRHGNDVMLIFGSGRWGGLYRWAWTGVSRLDSVPFPVLAAWADPDIVIAFGAVGGEVAQWDATGWRRLATRRRALVLRAAGVDRNALVAIGDFGDSSPDSILEYDGTSWETVDPRPPGVSALWKYDAVTTLADGSVAVGGVVQEPGKGDRPLLLIRSTSHVWRQLPLAPDSASTFSDITGIWGLSPDTMFVWGPCDDCSLVEIRKAARHEASDMGGGRVVGVARAGGTIYVVWADGSVWERRGQRWAYATEVPSLSRTAVSAGAVSWVLESNGTLHRYDCNRGFPCSRTTEPFSSVGFLRGAGRHQALVGGARGLLEVADSTGRWRRLTVPSAMAAESITFAQRGVDGDLVAVSVHHYVVFDGVGALVGVGSLARKEPPVGAWHFGDGSVVVGYQHSAAVMRGDSTAKQSNFTNTLVDGCELDDDRLVLGLTGDLSDPFSEGELLVYSTDSSFSRPFNFSTRLRTSVKRLDCSEQGTTGAFGVETPSGLMLVPLNQLPFRSTKHTAVTATGK